MAHKVTVDRQICAGYATCVVAAPDIFDIGDDNIAVVLVKSVEDEALPRAEEAARYCPVRAIEIG